ncbi:hypothetical protein GEV33_003556 [Tenebrio molitor]|uniref:Alpha-carbonic anhydrase domain-containing protein n=1 Tax=Tenebrio molitor TaxID=7067 RepID=A0A8J6HI80_TENMO|nr:hypothetical protein GEV33_003556 [Tenebrio molitor]
MLHFSLLAYVINKLCPAYWGLMNPQWSMCSRGRRQSPINVEPDKLLFDPHLQHIHLDKHKMTLVWGAFIAALFVKERLLPTEFTHTPTFTAAEFRFPPPSIKVNNIFGRLDKDTKQHVNISGGPLAYRYQFEEIYIHYGSDDQQGSEHHIHGYSFPAEVRLTLNYYANMIIDFNYEKTNRFRPSPKDFP